MNLECHAEPTGYHQEGQDYGHLLADLLKTNSRNASDHFLRLRIHPVYAPISSIYNNNYHLDLVSRWVAACCLLERSDTGTH